MTGTTTQDRGICAQEPLRVLELYCGIGGCAAAIADTAAKIVAIDINRLALAVYSHNFDHEVVPALVESQSLPRLAEWNADLWWMSPPCQPFTRRGLQLDLEDPRAATFLAVLDAVAAVRPPFVACENVPPFRRSRARARLLDTLDRAGYATVREQVLCPTELGVPNRRRRYYLIAARGRLGSVESPVRQPQALGRFLDPAPPAGLAVEPQLLESYRGAMHIVRADDPTAVTQCFTAAYGRSPVRSGSYLATETGVRYFSPAEILRLLGFPASFRLPENLPLRNAWRLAGNSLSIVAVRHVLDALPLRWRESRRPTIGTTPVAGSTETPIRTRLP